MRTLFLGNFVLYFKVNSMSTNQRNVISEIHGINIKRYLFTLKVVELAILLMSAGIVNSKSSGIGFPGVISFQGLNVPIVCKYLPPIVQILALKSALQLRM